MYEDNEIAAKAALWYRYLGYSVVPVMADGSKRSLHNWSNWTFNLASIEDIKGWYHGPIQLGVAIVTGEISGNLEVIDIDSRKAKLQFLTRISEELSDKLVLVDTPSGGMHVYYRCSVRAGKREKIADNIDLVGPNSYVIAPGSPATCSHESKWWIKASERGFEDLKNITVLERIELLDAAMNLATVQ